MNTFNTFFLTTLILIMTIACNQRSNKDNGSTGENFLPDSVYIAKGNSIVAKTFDTLRNSLLHAINDKGTDGAIEFCSEQAFSLTTLYSEDITIKRSSLRVRNENNSPDQLEESVLSGMSSDIGSGAGAQAKIVRQDGQVHFFKPILLQPICLNCHGDPGSEIQPKTLARIRELYPNDKATGYKVGDLRGIWHIVFQNKN